MPFTSSAVTEAPPPGGSFVARLDHEWLLVPFAVYALLVFSGDFFPDADSYYHLACARAYASEGWLSSFPWMKYTVLAEDFPNVHLLQHLALAPIARLFEPLTALRISAVLLPSALVVSVFLVLRRWGIPKPGLFVALVSVSSPVLLTMSVSIKGGALFSILLVWILDALRARALRRAAILAWLSAYAYVGAPILLLVGALHVAIRRIWDRTWDLAPAGWMLGGLAVGLVVNPFWPDHLVQIGAELLGAVRTPAVLVPGDFRGTEWISLSGKNFLRLAGVPVLAWAALLVRQLERSERVGTEDAFGATLALAFLGAAVLAAKFLYQFFLATFLFLPALAIATRPWSRRAIAVAVVAASVAGAYAVSVAHRDLYGTGRAAAHRAAGPADYRALGEWLPRQTRRGEVVVAPWDDFPGLFLFDTYNHYVVGLNTDFLLRYDQRKFNAYYLLYHGRVRDPENLLPASFGARVVVTRARPRNAGERRLNERLAANPRFRELESPSEAFRVFRMDGRGGG